MATLPPFSTSTILHMSHDILRKSTSISSLSDRDPAYLQDIFVSWLRKDQTNSYIPQTSLSNSIHFSFKNCSSAMLIDPSKHPVLSNGRRHSLLPIISSVPSPILLPWSSSHESMVPVFLSFHRLSIQTWNKSSNRLLLLMKIETNLTCSN